MNPTDRRPRSCFTADGKPKYRYDSRAEAKAAERALREQYPANKPLDPYRCPFCGYFHLGSYPKDEAARAGKRRRHHEESESAQTKPGLDLGYDQRLGDLGSDCDRGGELHDHAPGVSGGPLPDASETREQAHRGT
jgi:hypothetical protein